ncbi:uncharacterized protein LOC62_02G001875 [Vanrija pseudolonga]|uniref:Uncharacterized protein n=1 Tax=Vanrija pseudolonga TaxID=143232 RepID=A0AAF1BNN9_9TREE|nr:hypothetical protein LOC62_02G001875 [Vanrija pseudolonga]
MNHSVTDLLATTNHTLTDWYTGLRYTQFDECCFRGGGIRTNLTVPQFTASTPKAFDLPYNMSGQVIFHCSLNPEEAQRYAAFANCTDEFAVNPTQDLWVKGYLTLPNGTVLAATPSTVGAKLTAASGAGVARASLAMLVLCAAAAVLL